MINDDPLIPQFPYDVGRRLANEEEAVRCFVFAVAMNLFLQFITIRNV